MDKKIKDIRQVRGIVTVHKQSILRWVNGSFEIATTEEFQIWDRYQNSPSQSRRNLQARKLITDLKSVVCPGPLLETIHWLKNIVKSECKSPPPEAHFPLPHPERSDMIMGSKTTIGCLGKSKMCSSIKIYKLWKYCYRTVFQFQLQFSLWCNYVHTKQIASVQFSMTCIICFLHDCDYMPHIRIKRLSNLFR